jgi:cytochrome c biogenesis protein CcmG/thiol:disulfide interchange protein DsbE
MASDLAVRRRLFMLGVFCSLAAAPALAVLTTSGPGNVEATAGPAAPGTRPLDDVVAPTPSTSPPPGGRDIIVRKQNGPLVGRPAPDVTLTTFDGVPIRIRTLHGAPVVINFYASWCPSCRDELPQLGNLSAVLYQRVPMLGVATNDNPSDARAFAAEVGTAYMKVGADSTGSFVTAFLLLGVPGTVVIGPDSVIAADWRGPVPVSVLLDFLRTTYPDIVVPAAGAGGNGGPGGS